MRKLGLDRSILAQLFQKNHQAIVAFEQVLDNVGGVLPTTIEEAAAQANQAVAMAGQALAMVSELLAALEAIGTMPLHEAVQLPDDTAPAVQLGTVSSQNADNVEITGGMMSGATISTPSPLTSTVATGTAPLVIASTTRVANLNAASAGTADALTSPATYNAPATDLPTVIALTNQLRAAAITKGL